MTGLSRWTQGGMVLCAWTSRLRGVHRAPPDTLRQTEAASCVPASWDIFRQNLGFPWPLSGDFRGQCSLCLCELAFHRKIKCASSLFISAHVATWAFFTATSDVSTALPETPYFLALKMPQGHQNLLLLLPPGAPLLPKEPWSPLGQAGSWHPAWAWGLLSLGSSVGASREKGE